MKNIDLINEDIKRFKEIFNYISNEKIKNTYLVESTVPPTLEKKIETFLKDNFSNLKAIDNKADDLERLITRTIRDSDSSFYATSANKPIEENISKLFDLYETKVASIGDYSSPEAQDIRKAIFKLYKFVSEKGDESFAKEIVKKNLGSFKKQINIRLRQKANGLNKKVTELSPEEVKQVVEDYAPTIEYNLGSKIKTEYLKSFENYRGHLKSSKSDTNDVIPEDLGGTEGVKDFQEWMNKNYPIWNNGRLLSVNGKSYGKFGRKTADAWEIYGEKYLESNKAPSELKTPTEIKDFQDWMDKTNPNWYKDVDGKLINLEQGSNWGKYDYNTRKAWETHSKEYKKTWEIRQHIRAANLNDIESQGLSMLDRFLSTDWTLFGQFRKMIRLTYQKRLSLFDKEEKVINEIFGKLKNAIESLNKTGNLESNTTLLRDIVISINSLKEGKVDIFQTFIKDFESVLISSKKYKQEDINTVITYLKKVDPFNPTDKYGDMFLLKLWDESTYMKFWKEIRDKEASLGKKVADTGIRTAMFLVTGSIKKPNEIFKYIIDKGWVTGVFEYYLVMQVITKVTLPIFLIIWQLIVSTIMAAFSGFQNFSVLDEIQDEFENQYTKKFGTDNGEFTPGSILTGALVPWSFYWKRFIDGWDSVIRGDVNEQVQEMVKKQTDELTKKYEAKVDSLQEKYNEVLEKFENKKNEVVDKSKTEIENLKKQVKEKSFEAYLKLNTSRGEVFDGQEGLYYYTKDSEGKPHRYYFSNGTFVESSE